MLALPGGAQVKVVPRANLMTINIDEKLGFIFGRRSIRAYTPQAVSDVTVQKLLEASMAAPSAAATDP